MIPQQQKYLFNDGSGQFGDCHRTCIAMIFNLDRDIVPHFMADVPANAPADHPACVAAEEAEQAWLAQFGLTTVSVPYNGDMPLEDLLHQLKLLAKGPVLLGCQSANGNHSVVVHEGQIVNPHGEGIIAGPMRDGMWWITIYSVANHFVPLMQNGHLHCNGWPANVAIQEGSH